MIASGFPRSFERGSIEAPFPVQDALGLAVFPRSFERGSIEALQAGTRSTPSAAVSTFV